MGTRTRASSRKERQMGKESTVGETERSMTASGRRVSSMETACGKGSKEIHTLESGGSVGQRAMGCMYGKVATGMRESGLLVLSMDLEQTYSQTEMCTWEAT